MIQIATFCAMYEMNNDRNIYGFDAFGKFPTKNIAGTADRKMINDFTEAGGNGLSACDLSKIIELKGFKNVHLIEGDARETLPDFLEKYPEKRFNLVHLDMDVYEPTASVLSLIFPRVVGGGIIMFDDYNLVEGATRAVDEFMLAHSDLSLEKLPICHKPAFIVKK